MVSTDDDNWENDDEDNKDSEDGDGDDNDYDRDGDGMPTTSSPFDHHDHTHHDWSLSWSSSWYSSIDTIVGIKLPFPCCRFSDLPERVIVELFPFQFPHSICIPFQLISAAGIKNIVA